MRINALPSRVVEKKALGENAAAFAREALLSLAADSFGEHRGALGPYRGDLSPDEFEDSAAAAEAQLDDVGLEGPHEVHVRAAERDQRAVPAEATRHLEDAPRRGNQRMRGDLEDEAFRQPRRLGQPPHGGRAV